MRKCGRSFLHLYHGLVRVCEIELSHMGKINGNPDLVCEKQMFTIETLSQHCKKCSPYLGLKNPQFIHDVWSQFHWKILSGQGSHK